jgi:hypothetical protein
MLRRRLVALAATLAVSTFLAEPAEAAPPGPTTIPLPATFMGEGIATGLHGTFYVGSRATGEIRRGQLGSSETEFFASSPTVLAATGLKVDLRHGLLWVSGAGTGRAVVYDLETGAEVAALTLNTTAPTFINDVVVTRDAAYFTNSQKSEIYRVPVSIDGDVGDPVTIALTGDAADDFVAGAFNLNGIEATGDGRTLIAVNSGLGTLYTIDASTGDSARIDLGGDSVATGDGILLWGGRLLVLQNGGGGGTNQVAVVLLSMGLTHGRIVDTVAIDEFDTATTLARSGGQLLAVNAQFATGGPTNPPEVVVFRLG